MESERTPRRGEWHRFTDALIVGIALLPPVWRSITYILLCLLVASVLGTITSIASLLL